VSLIGQPCFAGPICATINRVQDASRTRDLPAHSTRRYSALAHPEKNSQVAITYPIKNNALAEFMVSDLFAGLKLVLYFHAETLCNSQVE
jgi:hypothetical protein